MEFAHIKSYKKPNQFLSKNKILKKVVNFDVFYTIIWEFGGLKNVIFCKLLKKVKKPKKTDLILNWKSNHKINHKFELKIYPKIYPKKYPKNMPQKVGGGGGLPKVAKTRGVQKVTFLSQILHVFLRFY